MGVVSRLSRALHGWSSASSAAVTALLLGSAAYGMAGGIVGASIFFVIGGAVGAVLQARWRGAMDMCCWTKNTSEQMPKLMDLELTTGCAPASPRLSALRVDAVAKPPGARPAECVAAAVVTDYKPVSRDGSVYQK